MASAAGISASPHAQILGQFSNTVSSDYVIGAEDVLEITVWRNQDLSKTVQVRPDGKFSMPVIRDVTAVGKTASLLADEITKKLKEYVQNPLSPHIKEANLQYFLLASLATGEYPLKANDVLQGSLRPWVHSPGRRNQAYLRFKDNDRDATHRQYEISARGGVRPEFDEREIRGVPRESMVISRPLRHASPSAPVASYVPNVCLLSLHDAPTAASRGRTAIRISGPEDSGHCRL